MRELKAVCAACARVLRVLRVRVCACVCAHAYGRQLVANSVKMQEEMCAKGTHTRTHGQEDTYLMHVLSDRIARARVLRTGSAASSRRPSLI